MKFVSFVRLTIAAVVAMVVLSAATDAEAGRLRCKLAKFKSCEPACCEEAEPCCEAKKCGFLSRIKARRCCEPTPCCEEETACCGGEAAEAAPEEAAPEEPAPTATL